MSNQNIFELLTDDPTEYNYWSLKSKLMITTRLIIKEQNITQSELAEKLGVSQPRVSNLINGKSDKFSIDSLLQFLFKLGFSGDIQFDPRNLESPLDFKLRKAVL